MIRPPYIYKYYSINEFTLDAILNNYFWFCDIEKLNDPLDGRYLHSEKLLKKYNMPSKMNEELTKIFLWGVCSFTTNNNNILMWSHYANNHKGICLEFITLNERLLSEMLHPIIYTNKKPIINDFKDIMHKGLFRKSKNWQYESEWRLLGPADEKMNYNPKALSSIYLGAKIEKHDEERILSCIKLKSHINIKRASVNILSQCIEF
ncbi:MAG: DUF2971 domain-containing protein [Saprospiraceae bacterium]|nr:DUF2971 domain-containing protein [Saprospiraceae bacterium]